MAKNETSNSKTSGSLTIYITSLLNNYPIIDASIQVSGLNFPTRLISDSQGMAFIGSIPTPDISRSLDENDTQRPYSLISITVTHPLYQTVTVNNLQILPEVASREYVRMIPLTSEQGNETFDIGPNVLYGDYPPHVTESEIKELNSIGGQVLDSVKIPEYIIVHDGLANAAANDYWVPYKDYIKNVASSEIYATWPTAAIYANILAIQSFTLNRVYTEWYRGKGKPFTITSSTTTDHKWIAGRNIYDTIEQCVDSVFSNYISRPGIKQPILTQYCDGKKVNCPGQMTQWGSKNLADKGYSAIEILRYYYGQDIYLNTATQVSGVPSSYPNYDLKLGSSGVPVRTIQRQLNTIAGAYPLIPKLTIDGSYGPATKRSVEVFQQIFGMPVTGIVDLSTWYKISQLYVGVSQIA